MDWYIYIYIYLNESIYICIYIIYIYQEWIYPYRDISPSPWLQCPRREKNIYIYNYIYISFKHYLSAYLMRLNPSQQLMNQLTFSEGKDRPAKFAMVSPCFKSLNGCILSNSHSANWSTPLPSVTGLWHANTTAAGLQGVSCEETSSGKGLTCWAL